ncbi:unnamed protein product [Natator depressus]
MLEGLEDDLFVSYFLTITCSPARHLSGAQQDLPSDASPHSMAVHALARVLHLRGSQPAVELMDPGARLAAAGGGPALGLLFSSRAMVIHTKQALKSIPRLLLPNLQVSQEGELMARTALFSEFLGSPLLMENEPKAMQKQVVRAMLQWTEDSNIHIQGRALHGLRNAGQEETRPDPGELCPCHVQMLRPRAVLDTMEGLCWMLRKPKVPLKGHVAVLLALQARTFFEDNSGLRQTSMELFGHLSKFVSKSSLFRAEVEKSIGTLLIHLQDRNPQDTWWTTEAREEKAWNARPANPAWHTPGSHVADPP